MNFFIKIFSKSGSDKKVYNDIDFTDFSDSIDGGLGVCSVTIYKESNVDGFSVDDKVEIWESGGFVSSPSGRLIYSGMVQRVQFAVTQETSTIVLSCVGAVAQLGFMPFIDSGSPYKNYSVATDISTMLANMITSYQASVTDNLITSTSISTSTVTIVREFDYMMIDDCIRDVTQFKPVGWFWHVGRDNIFTFKQKTATADHSIDAKANISKGGFSVELSADNYYTHVFATNMRTVGDPDRYNGSDSNVGSYHERAMIKVDPFIDSTAQANALATSILDDNNTVTLEAVELSIANYDIGSIEAGQTCSFLNKTFSFLDGVFLIASLTRSKKSVSLKLEKKRENQNFKFKELEKKISESIRYTNLKT